MTLASPRVSEGSSTVAAFSAALRSPGSFVSLSGPRCTRCRLTSDGWQSSFSSATQREMNSSTLVTGSTCRLAAYLASATCVDFTQSVHPVAGCRSAPPDARVSLPYATTHAKSRQAVASAHTCCCAETAMGGRERVEAASTCGLPARAAVYDVGAERLWRATGGQLGDSDWPSAGPERVASGRAAARTTGWLLAADMARKPFPA